jgi:hypothetical protein
MTRVRKTLALMAVLGVGVALSPAGVSTLAAAEAGGPCATKSEFKKVKRGMSRYRVANILDSDGKLKFRSGPYMTREYPACARYAFILVDYRRGQVDGKTGAWI